jgi:predicted O-methyltransferase YrrM
LKSHPDPILRPAQARYVERLLPPRDALLTEMEALAAREAIPISDPEVGRLLEILAAASKARRILEVGTAIGYGTLCLARGAPQAEVVSIDVDPARLAQARGFLERGLVAGRVRLLAGPALEILPTLEGPFDLVYVDALKTEYRRYLDLALPLVALGGLVVVDNLLWKGKVAAPGPEDLDDESTRAIGAFNPYLMIHPQLRAVLLPVGDGVGLASKSKPLIRELGGPF